MLATQDLITELRKTVETLYSADVQLQIEENLNESEAKAVLKERENLSRYLHKLEKQSLQVLLTKMKANEPELKQAIDDLDANLKDINNTVNVLANIRKVTGILTNVLAIV